MTELLTLDAFIKSPGVIFDVRSPAEFSQGRIPRAVNLPLFTNAERALIGTAYKQQGKQQAIDLGLKLVGPKLADFIAQARQHAPEGIVKVHCWRGGMRSAAMAWLLSFAGFHTSTLIGGYKVFRRWALDRVASHQYNLIVIGGMTGSGKTSILHALKSNGAQVLDLEACANHRGSSFGMLGSGPQPSNEQFENEIAIQLSSFDISQAIWVEDESRQIGSCNIPSNFFQQMRSSLLIHIEVPIQERLARLLNEYGNTPPEQLANATKRIQKRLGSQRTKLILDAIESGKLEDAIELVLRYYDSAYVYNRNLEVRQKIQLSGESLSPSSWAKRLIETAHNQTPFHQSSLSKAVS